MGYQFDVNSFIELITAFVAILIIIILWKYRNTIGVKYLIYLEFLVAIWAIIYAIEFSVSTLEKKIFFAQLSYFPVAFIPLTYFLFTTGFSQKSDLITKRNIILLSIVPIITLFLVFTNHYHHLIWIKVELDPVVNIAHYNYGLWFWIFFAHTQLLVFSGLYFLVNSLYKFSSYYKSQVITLLIGSLIPVLGNLVYVTKLNPLPGFDWTTVSFVLTGAIITFGILRYKMFDLLPIARSKLLDILNDGIIVVNTNCIIEDYNPELLKILGTKNKSYIGEPFEEVFKDFKLKLTEFDREKEEQTEILYKKNRTKTYFNIKFTPLYNQKKFSGNLIILHDITQVKEAEHTLKQTNEQLLVEIEQREKLISDLDAFAHSVAHGLKNPLAAIVSSSNLIQDNISTIDKESLVELNEIIKSAADKTMHITNELLTLASVRKQEIKSSPLNMTRIVKEAEITLASMIKQSKAEITKPKNFPVALGYATWIEEVWVNYISNAIKYGGKPPKVEIGATHLDNGFIKFWIKDNGDGLPKDKQELLFHQFTRLNPAVAEGHGLGLSIARRILEKLDGTIGVESTNTKGEGCLFYFVLPGKNG